MLRLLVNGDFRKYMLIYKEKGKERSETDSNVLREEMSKSLPCITPSPRC